jgi:hypothetical protein
MILRLLRIWLVFYSLLSSLMHGTMNLKKARKYFAMQPATAKVSQLKIGVPSCVQITK